MSGRVARKRARTESEETPKQDPEEADTTPADPQPGPSLGGGHGEQENENLERDEEFWISDGTIILVAMNVEFRFYRALLANRSPVFKAMFASQHPSRLVPIDEHQSITCPVVHLTESPQDLRHILRACISGAQTSFLEAAEPSFDEISAYIRLGRKYELKELYEHSHTFLRYHYTDDFKIWTQAQHWGPRHWPANAAVGVIRLARLIDEPSLLPTALLTCIYMKDDIMHGFAREDGTRETLALDDLGRCFRAGATIRQATVAGVVRTLRDRPAAGCETRMNCEAALRRALQALERVDWLVGSCPIRLSADRLLSAGKVKRGLDACTVCEGAVRGRSRKEQLGLWERLPDLLDVEVPGWIAEGQAS